MLKRENKASSLSYEQFHRDWTTILAHCDASGLQPKYLSATGQYARFLPLMKKIGVLPEPCRGLDFGCGPGLTLLLAKQMGVHVEGLDLPWDILRTVPESETNPSKDDNYMPRGPRGLYESFFNIQQRLNHESFFIKHVDTSQYPWPYDENTFNFVIASWSITKDVISWRVSGRQEIPQFLPGRICEIARILAPAGSLFIQGGSGKTSHAKLVRQYGDIVLNNKKIKVLEF